MNSCHHCGGPIVESEAGTLEGEMHYGCLNFGCNDFYYYIYQPTNQVICYQDYMFFDDKYFLVEACTSTPETTIDDYVAVQLFNGEMIAEGGEEYRKCIEIIRENKFTPFEDRLAYLQKIINIRAFL